MSNIENSQIHAEKVSFIYKSTEERALDRVNLRIKKGKFILLCGPTGSGKTSLIRTINGLIPHFYHGKFFGYLKINGKDSIEDNNPAKISKTVGSVFQNPENQLFALTVEREIVFALENLGFDREIIKKRIDSAFEMTNIHHLRNKAPFDLSGGEQQRVAIASVLAIDPEILIFDEPLSSLDPKTAHQIVFLLKNLQKQYNKTIIISEHRIEYVLSYLDEIIIIKDGAILLHDSTDNVLNNPIFYNQELDIPPVLYWLYEKNSIYNLEMKIPQEKKKQIDMFQSLLNVCLDSNEKKKNIKQPALSTNQIETCLYSKQAAIIFKNVYFSYKSDNIREFENIPWVLKDINFEIQRGSIIGIVGENGVGKTTLIKCMIGLLKPQKGEIWIDNELINDKPVFEIAKKIGLMFQNPDHQLFLNSVIEELEFSLKSLKISDIEKKDRIKRTLETLNIYDLKDKSPFQISGGQKKKVSLAAVLCRDPQILVFDEPTIGQDKKQKDNLLALIRELKRREKTSIIVSHDMNFIANIADLIIVMYKDQIYTVGTSKEIFEDYDVLSIASLRALDSYEYIQSLKSDLIPKNICTIEALERWLE